MSRLGVRLGVKTNLLVPKTMNIINQGDESLLLEQASLF
jgi:hypothetical protein